MDNKISWYEEILALEPHSKLFYSLAVLYRDAGQPEKALTVLADGLQNHPEHFPARLLQAQLYWEQDRQDEAARSLEPVLDNLERTPCLWPLWAQACGEENASTALALAGAVVQKQAGSLEAVLRAGLDAVTEPAGPAPSPQEQTSPENADNAGAQEAVVEAPSAEEDSPAAPSESPADSQKATGPDADPEWPDVSWPEETPAAEEPDPFEEASDSERAPVRTKTMAAILAQQGECAEAEAIYSDLLQRTSDPGEREELTRRLEEVRRQRQESQEQQDSQDLLSTLQHLAQRLEARGSETEEKPE